MNKTLKLFLIIGGVIMAVLIIMGIVAVVLSTMFAVSVIGNAAKAEEYTIGTDAIPSMKAVVEERQITSMSTQMKNGVTTKEMEFSSDSVQDDLVKYIQYLRTYEQFYLMKDVDLSTFPGTIQLVKESVEENQIIVMVIEYDAFEYIIKIQKGEGTLEFY